MEFFTETRNIPWIFGFLAIFTVELPNGFFMNWFGQQKGESIEFSPLMIGMSLALIVSDGGRWALDGVIVKKAKA